MDNLFFSVTSLLSPILKYFSGKKNGFCVYSSSVLEFIYFPPTLLLSVCGPFLLNTLAWIPKLASHFYALILLTDVYN